MRLREAVEAYWIFRIFKPSRRPAPTATRFPPAARGVGCMVYVAVFWLVAFAGLLLLWFGPYVKWWILDSIHQIISLPWRLKF